MTAKFKKQAMCAVADIEEEIITRLEIAKNADWREPEESAVREATFQALQDWIIEIASEPIAHQAFMGTVEKYYKEIANEKSNLGAAEESNKE